MNVGNKLKSLRKQNNLTLKELHSKTGLSISFISDIENKRRNPSIDNLRILATALGVSADEFFKENNDSYSIIAANVKKYRKKNNMSVNELAKLSLINVNYINAIEKGIGEPPSRDILSRIAMALSVNIPDLTEEISKTYTPDNTSDEKFVSTLEDEDRELFDKIKSLTPEKAKIILDLIETFEKNNNIK